MNWTYTLEELSEVAEKILAQSLSKTFLFYGDLGAGKTTLIKEMGSQLGVKEPMSSPTFSIVNEHKLNDCKLYHCDFYRLKNEEEALDLGVEEYFEPPHYTLIEWPDKINSLIPGNSTRIELNKNTDGSRTLKLSVPVK